MDGETVFEVAWSRFEVTGRTDPGEPGDSGETAGDGEAGGTDTPSGEQSEPVQPAEDPAAQTWTEAEEAAAYAEAEE